VGENREEGIQGKSVREILAGAGERARRGKGRRKYAVKKLMGEKLGKKNNKLGGDQGGPLKLDVGQAGRAFEKIIRLFTEPERANQGNGLLSELYRKR